MSERLLRVLTAGHGVSSPCRGTLAFVVLAMVVIAQRYLKSENRYLQSIIDRRGLVVVLLQEESWCGWQIGVFVFIFNPLYFGCLEIDNVNFQVGQVDPRWKLHSQV